jgi:hypothetical protein
VICITACSGAEEEVVTNPHFVRFMRERSPPAVAYSLSIEGEEGVMYVYDRGERKLFPPCQPTMTIDTSVGLPKVCFA